MRRRLLALCAGLAMVAASCSGAHHRAAPPTTASGPNPDVIPAVITPAYVDAVFRVLNHIQGDATRALVAAGSVTPGVLEDIRAIYNDPLYAEEVRIAHETASGGFSGIIDPPGDVTTSVVRLYTATKLCIFVSSAEDYSKVLRNPGNPATSEYWSLAPKTPGDDPNSLNSTPWAIAFNAVYKTPTSIPDQCAGH